jgi:hypothetical protein
MAVAGRATGMGVSRMSEEAIPVPEVRTRRREVNSTRHQAALLARRVGLSTGEVLELLERLPFGDDESGNTPESWQRPVARRLLEQYAARKRAVARLAVHGDL